MKKEKREELKAAPFRFLSHEEFAALSQEERAKYLRLALEAIRGGHPLDDLPSKDRH